MGDTFSRKNICCVIITYNPTGIFLKLADAIKNQVDCLIIVDNCSEGESLEIILPFADNNKVHLIRNDQNLGIAKALNQGVLLADELKYKWAITFDQDTQPFDNIIGTISEVYSLYHVKIRIGAIGVNFSNENSSSNYRRNDNEKFREKDYLITSGCLISIAAFNEIGGFREDFFIDNVDLEYSLRLRKYNWISLMAKKPGMSHMPGAPRIKLFLGFKVISSNHNVIRRYYMARNHTLLTKEYLFTFPYFIIKLNYFFFLSIFQLIIADDNRKEKIFACLRGLKDGILYPSRLKKLAIDKS
jgi:rhamnosyltransferase